jgi:hypothetical protein
MPRSISIVGLALLFAFALARFAYDSRRLIYPVNDLTPVWVSAKAFVAGKNPYNDIQEFERIWATTGIASADGCADYSCILRKYPMGYPPTALPLLAPLALFDWRTAVDAYLAGSIVLFVAMVLMLARRLQLPWSNLRTLYMIAFALALAPLHAGIHHSNLNTFVIVCLGAGVIFMTERPCVSGIALAISFCLKPQVAFLFFAYPWLRRRWRTAFTGVGACAIITTVSLLWASFHHVELFRAYLDSLARFMPPGGHNSFYSPSPERYTLINFQVLAFQFTHIALESNILSWVLCALLATASAVVIHSRVSEKNDGIDIAIISVVTLLPVYQQIYTAAILIFVVYWAIESWPQTRAKAALLLMLPLLFPFVAMTLHVPSLTALVERLHLGSYFFWNAFVMPHVVWIELLLVAILLTELWGTITVPNIPSWGRWRYVSHYRRTSP